MVEWFLIGHLICTPSFEDILKILINVCLIQIYHNVRESYYRKYKNTRKYDTFKQFKNMMLNLSINCPYRDIDIFKEHFIVE